MRRRRIFERGTGAHPLPASKTNPAPPPHRPPLSKKDVKWSGRGGAEILILLLIITTLSETLGVMVPRGSAVWRRDCPSRQHTVNTEIILRRSPRGDCLMTKRIQGYFVNRHHFRHPHHLFPPRGKGTLPFFASKVLPPSLQPPATSESSRAVSHVFHDFYMLLEGAKRE